MLIYTRNNFSSELVIIYIYTLCLATNFYNHVRTRPLIHYLQGLCVKTENNIEMVTKVRPWSVYDTSIESSCLTTTWKRLLHTL